MANTGFGADHAEKLMGRRSGIAGLASPNWLRQNSEHTERGRARRACAMGGAAMGDEVEWLGR